MRKKSALSLFISSVLMINVAYASITVPIYLVAKEGEGKKIGTVTLEEETCGVLITPNLQDLPPGSHGFHVHVNPDCGNNGMAAGGHLDPDKTDKHNGPYLHQSHLGDLPVLLVNQNGTATLPTFAPRFKLSEMQGHALMIHAGSDNYSDKPEKLGGGGERIACGVIK